MTRRCSRDCAPYALFYVLDPCLSIFSLGLSAYALSHSRRSA